MNWNLFGLDGFVFIHFFLFSAGSLDYIEEEYVDLDWKENVSTVLPTPSKRIQQFKTLEQGDFKFKFTTIFANLGTVCSL